MEKRYAKRIEFKKPVGFEINIMRSGKTKNIKCKGWGVDISSYGIGAIAPCFFDNGEVLKMHLPAENVTTEVPVFAEVVWAKIENEKCRLGLRFLQ